MLQRLMRGAGYERAFHERMMAAVRPGDRIWDVGANIGHYTTLFADAGGPECRVYAFEPSPQNIARLEEAVRGRENVTLVPMALGKTAGTVSFEQGEDDIGATSRVVATPGAGGISVRVERGDQLIAEGKAEAPDFMKIDVEGFEGEVLQGLSDTLSRGRPRTLCLEVHFGLLQGRGTPDAPRAIERLLLRNGYHLSWTDPSHIIAERR